MIKLVVLCGFLGSGKTTFLQSFLKRHLDSKIGVLMNEISLIDIDGLRLEVSNDHMQSVVNGSIFCSCKSDQFIEKLIMLSKEPLDYILVESSGLADPSSIHSLISIVQKQVSLDFLGIITMIAAPSAHKLLSTCNAVRKQVELASIVLLTKCDLAMENVANQAVILLKEINPNCQISTMTNGEYDDSILVHLKPFHVVKEDSSSTINHQKLLFQIVSHCDENNLYSFLQAMNPYVDRIKGFITLNETPYYIEYIDESLHLDQVITQDYIDVVAAITTQNIDLKQMITKFAIKHNIKIEVK